MLELFTEELCMWFFLFFCFNGRHVVHRLFLFHWERWQIYYLHVLTPLATSCMLVISVQLGNDVGWFLADKDSGRLMISYCTPVGGCRVGFLMRRPCCFLDRWRFRPRMIGRLLASCTSCVCPLWHYDSVPWTYDWPFSLMSANCLGLRPPAVMTDGWFPI